MQTRNKFHTNSEDKYNVDWERWYDQMLDIKLRRERGQILTVAHSLDKVLESLSEFTRLKWENIHIYYYIQNAVADIMVLSFILTWTTWGSPPQSAIWRKEDRTTFNSFRHTKSTHACTHTQSRDANSSGVKRVTESFNFGEKPQGENKFINDSDYNFGNIVLNACNKWSKLSAVCAEQHLLWNETLWDTENTGSARV